MHSVPPIYANNVAGGRAKFSHSTIGKFNNAKFDRINISTAVPVNEGDYFKCLVPSCRLVIPPRMDVGGQASKRLSLLSSPGGIGLNNGG